MTQILRFLMENTITRKMNMAIKTTCAQCGDKISIPEYVEGDFLLCVRCQVENQTKMIKEDENGN